MRRSGQVLTGIDRVELAYLSAVLANPVPAFALIRAPLGYILLDQAGMTTLVPFLSGPVSESDPKQQRRDTWRAARRLALGRVPPAVLGRMLRRHLPSNVAYLNVGHSNLTDRVLQTLRDAVGAQIAVLIHDVIPLDFPHYQREGTVAPFAAMIARVAHCADLVIYNSHDTKRQTEARMAQAPASIVSFLGTELAVAAPAELPEVPLPHPPYFVCVGTIEPRKNHAFLLDIWDEMGPNAPGLVIAGSRGWKNEAVFARLDALPLNGAVREVTALSDSALAAVVESAAGVLLPTHAEGYGLPAVDAAARGIPIIANDLNVFKETLGEIPIYASVSDRYLWINKIKALADTQGLTPKAERFQPPTWDAHFKAVLRLT